MTSRDGTHLQPVPDVVEFRDNRVAPVAVDDAAPLTGRWAELAAEAARLDALLTAADKLGVQYIATGHHARIETGSDGTNTVLAPAGSAPDESGLLCALPPETLARLILPLGEFDPADLDALAAELGLD